MPEWPPARIGPKLLAVTPLPERAVPEMLPPFTVVCRAPRKAADPAAPVFSISKWADWPAATVMVSVPFTLVTVVPSTPITVSWVPWPSIVPVTPASGL